MSLSILPLPFEHVSSELSLRPNIPALSMELPVLELPFVFVTVLQHLHSAAFNFLCLQIVLPNILFIFQQVVRVSDESFNIWVELVIPITKPGCCFFDFFDVALQFRHFGAIEFELNQAFNVLHDITGKPQVLKIPFLLVLGR